MARVSFTDAQVKQIAKEYVFQKVTYKQLAEKYGCSDSKISHMMNHELQDISKFWFKLVSWKAEHNKKVNLKKFTGKK